MGYAVITGDVINSYVDYKNRQQELLKKIKSVYRFLQSAYSEILFYEINLIDKSITDFYKKSTS